MTEPFVCPICDATEPCSVECAKHAKRRRPAPEDFPPYEPDRLPPEDKP